MLMEIALIQRLSVLLSHPVYALGILLFTMILSTGIGSLLSERLPLTRWPWVLVYPLLAVAATLSVSTSPTPAQSRQRRGFSVAITEPANQSVVFGKTRIAAEVEIRDPQLLDRVEFLVGDDVIFVDREPPFECSYDFGEASKSWIIRAVAYHVEEVTVSDALGLLRCLVSYRNNASCHLLIIIPWGLLSCIGNRTCRINHRGILLILVYSCMCLGNCDCAANFAYGSYLCSLPDSGVIFMCGLS